MGSRKNIWCFAVVLLLGLLWGEKLFAITIAPYFPIKEGKSWTYAWTYNNATGTYTTTVLSGTVPVNGIITSVFQDTDGLKVYITNDGNGIRIHRVYDPSEWFDGLGYRSVDVVYSPPMQIAYAEATIGSSVFSTGTATVNISGAGTFNLTYTLTSTINGLENITVPAGSYQAVKISRDNFLTGNVLGEYLSEASTETDWLVKDIGAVKYSELDNEGLWEEELISTHDTLQEPTAVYSDFNGDATSDILFQNSDDGRLLIWTMNNFNRSLHFPKSLAKSWSVVGKGDFNGDGSCDVLYRKIAGDTAIALMNNATRSSLAFPGGLNTVWTVQGVGDFNGDGTDDILWRRSTDGVTMIWGMHISDRTLVIFPGALAKFWDVVGVGDFDNDGTDDILYQHNSDGRLLIWKINNYSRTTVKFAKSLANTWTVVGVGDFNADGTDDVLYRKDAGNTAIAEFNNLNRSALKFPGGIGTMWSVKDAGDYNGDGSTDILFRRNTDNVTAIWDVKNSQRTNVKFPGALAAQWVVQKDGSNSNIKTGVFLDSAVEGLTYISGSQMGETDQDGMFQYEEGKDVSFYIGNILIGTTQGQELVLPTNLVGENIQPDDPTVTNISRFLLTLDQDADPSNGILISAEVRSKADGLSLDFMQSIEGFENSEVTISVLNQLTGGLDNGPRDLVPSSSIIHLMGTIFDLNSSFVGIYSGNYIGAESGDFSFGVDLGGNVISLSFGECLGPECVTGKVVPNGSINFIGDGRLNFTGKIQDNHIIGSWSDGTGGEGTFDAEHTPGEPPKLILDDHKVTVYELNYGLKDPYLLEFLVGEAISEAASHLAELVVGNIAYGWTLSVVSILNIIQELLDPVRIVPISKYTHNVDDRLMGPIPSSSDTASAIVFLDFIGAKMQNADLHWYDTDLTLSIEGEGINTGDIIYREQVLLTRYEIVSRLDSSKSYMLIPKVPLSLEGMGPNTMFGNTNIYIEAKVLGWPLETHSQKALVYVSDYPISDETLVVKIESPESGRIIEVGESLYFEGSHNLPGEFDYEWDFGGAAPNSTLKSPGDVAFLQSGAYRVSFNAHSHWDGKDDIDEIWVFVSPNPDEVEPPPFGSCHTADTNCDSCIDMMEVTAYIAKWKSGSGEVTMSQLMEAIGLWKQGCNEPCNDAHAADTDCDGCIEMPELMSYIEKWKSGTGEVTMAQLMEAIGLWKQGCDGATGRAIADYFPMSLGDEWIYYQQYVEDGEIYNDWVKFNVFDQTTLPHDPDTSVTPIGVSYSNNGVDFDTPESGYYTLDLNGLIARGVDAWYGEGDISWGAGFDPPLELFPVFIAEGDQGEASSTLNDGRGLSINWSWEILAFDEIVNVAAGEFNDTIKVKTRIQEVENGVPSETKIHEKTEWYAKGVGLVKVEAKVNAEGNSDGGFPGLGDVELNFANINGTLYGTLPQP